MTQLYKYNFLSTAKRKVFISYQSQDRSAAQALAHALNMCDEGVEAFFDRYDLRAGAFWIPAIEQAIDDADAMVLLLGSRSPGTWQRLEYLQAIDRKARRPEFAIVPVLLSEAMPRLPFLYQLNCLRTAYPWKAEYLRRILDAIAGKTATPMEPWHTVNPYRGLLSMTDSDGDFFFGREDLTAHILNHLRRDHRFLALIGNSGV